MQATKLQGGKFQVISTEDMTAPDGTTYTRTYVDITDVPTLTLQLAKYQTMVVDAQTKITAIQALPDNQ